MPELPEVRTVVKYLNETVIGKKIVNTNVQYAKLLKNISVADFKKIMPGQTILSVQPKGKYIIFRLTNNDMISHLRMEGKWVYENKATFIYSEHNMELQFEFENDTNVLRYYDSRRFGTLDVVAKDTWQQFPAIAKLGPEPFDKECTPEYLYSKFQKTRTAIKTVLLDQTVILGIGNIYANEILYAAKINPLTPANQITLDQCKKILEDSKNILSEAIKDGGTTIMSFKSGANHAGSFQDHLMVHGRAGKKCKNCGATIEKMEVNGRGTYYCPVEQK